MADREVILLDSDSDEDEDLRRAIELSLQNQDAVKDDDADAVPEGAQKFEAAKQATFGSITLDRKEMEDARLSRLGKRRRNSNSNEGAEEPATKRLTPQQSEWPGAAQPPYPQGIVRRTWTKGYPRTCDDITIEEVFQREELQLALLSSFQWDDEWLLSKLNVGTTRVLLLAFAADEKSRQAMKVNAPKNVRFCFPPMHGPGSMHSKLQILKYANYLRVVIPTGNLVPYDWGETGVMENMVFLIDLPRLDAHVTCGMTVFGENVARFLSAAGVDDVMVKSLANYDFSATESLGFVSSIPGSHTGSALRCVGYCGLGATVKGLGLATDTAVEVDIACASLGSINGVLVNAIYNACQGDDGMREYNTSASGKPKGKDVQPAERLRDRFRIYFPTDRTVSKSKGGRQSAGTICVQAKWWRSPSFPRELVRDCVNNRAGLLMHSKLIFVRRLAGETQLVGNDTPPTGWAYIGSANLSESAWGRVVKDRDTGSAKISCRNWECGVIVPVKGDPSNNGDFAMFSGVVPVPMEVPGRLYDKADAPWFYLGGY